MNEENTKYHALDLYRPSHCEVAKQLLGEGVSLTGLAAQLEVAYRTICYWRKKHPDFDWACEIGVTKGLASWEKLGRANIDNAKFNNTMYIFTLKSQYQVRDSDPPQQQNSNMNYHAVFGLDADKHSELKDNIINQATNRGEINNE